MVFAKIGTTVADYSTLSELLAAQSEKKLIKLKVSILSEIQRLGLELRLVEDALNRKGRNRVASAVAAIGNDRPALKTPNAAATNGGLSRADLLGYVREIGHPTTPAEVRDFLASKGIVRRIEAIRVALSRLLKAGALVRTEEGKYAVPSSNGDGAKVGSGGSLWDTQPDMEGVATPDE